MFEDRPPAELIDVMSAAARAESVPIAQRLAAVAALHADRARDFAERRLWLCDAVVAVAAEVSAAQNISRARASIQVQTAVALYQRLPKVAAVFITGAIDYRMGHTSITEAHGAALFPALAQPTGAVPASTPTESSAQRGAMMPKRRRTRGQIRAARIKRERQRRLAIDAELEHHHQAWIAATYEPPPF